MSQLRIKAQALALVLIVVVVAIVVAFAISNRVIQDTQQQGQERASTRAETFAESAIDDLTLQIQGGEVVPNEHGQEYAISTESPSGIPVANAPLAICDPNSTDVTKQCDPQSVAKILFYKYVLQFKYFDAENLEIFLTEPGTTPAAKSIQNDSGVIIYLEPNDSYDPAKSKILIKGFTRGNATKELRPVSECLIGVTENSGACLPNILHVVSVTCPQNISIPTNNNTNTKFPVNPADFHCVSVSVSKPADRLGYAIDLYRIRPILTKATGKTEVPYMSLSVTSNNATDYYRLPTFHMAMITAGVYSGTTASDQQVFQQKTRLVLTHKTVPEMADYVLYNGSDQPIRK